jgi:hypothetical protein
LPNIIHEEGNFIWIFCPACGERLVKAKEANYRLTIEDAHRIHELTPILFYPKHFFRYEEGCISGSWHIIPKLQERDDGAEG